MFRLSPQVKSLSCEVFGADIATTQGNEAGSQNHPCPYTFGASLIGHLDPRDKRITPYALSKMFKVLNENSNGILFRSTGQDVTKTLKRKKAMLSKTYHLRYG